ncbi:MAG TPA: hypothetical protein VIV11_14470 [Kofleriaceae bacterium]
MKRISMLVALLVTATTAHAAPKGQAARAQFDKGVTAYTKGDYAAAAEALGASFVLEADVETLFAWAQTERKLGHCDRASELYRKLLGMNLPAENKEAIQVQINECKVIIADQKKAAKTAPKPDPKVAPKPEPKVAPKPDPKVAPKPVEAKPVEPTPVPVQPTPEPAPTEVLPVEPVQAEGRVWWKDPIGGAVVGAGVVGLGLGIVFLVQGSAAESDKATAMSYPEYESLANRAESRGRLGVISLVAGSALIACGVVRYVTLKPSKETQVTTLALPGGGGLALSGRF